MIVLSEISTYNIKQVIISWIKSYLDKSYETEITMNISSIILQFDLLIIIVLIIVVI